MAAVRSRAQLPVGSAQWINDENDQVTQFCDQEIEDFTFSARNEVEWLNEHMAEIFSKNQVNVTEIFKTPGKLRGKTPRTARKRNPLEAREPLTDIFSVNARTNGSPLQRASPFKPAPSFQVAEDPVAHIVAKKPTKENTDSGYRDVSEDENVDIHQVPAVVQSSAESHEEFPPLSYGEEPNMTSQSGDHSTTEPSFHSAKEEITKRDVTKVSPKKEAELNGDVESRAEPTKDDAEVQVTSMPEQLHEDAMGMDVEDKDLDEDLIVDESRSPSQGSSPARPLVRKSSLTFAALPAREPLTTKKSIGSSVSRTSHLDQSKGPASRGSFLGRFTGGKSLGGYKQPESAPEVEKDDEMDVAMDRPALAHEESEDSKMTKLHNKSSTQRLHERINMLGKSQPARPTKSIPAAAATNLSYPELPIAEPQPQNLQQTASMALKSVTTQSNEEDDDDWIQSPQPLPNASSRPQLSKSLSVDVMEDIREKQSTRSQEFDLDQNDREATREPSPLHQTQGHQLNRLDITRAASTIESEALRKAQAAANVKSTHGTASPALARAHEAATSTTPVGSPSSKRYVDGPLSASKSKLQFIMKTARGLFSSSAGVSTQAKMETLSPPSMRTNGEPRARSIDDALQSKSAEGRKSNSPASHVIGRRTRSSTEKEERRKEVEAKERQRAEVEPERHREQVSVKAGPHKPAQTSAPAKPTRQSPRKAPNQEASKEHADVAETDVPPQSMGPPPPHAQGQPPQTQRLKDVRRPIKPGKETALKPKPQPVAIRVGTLSQGLRMNNAALSSSLQDSLPPQPKQPIVTKKPSNASLHSAASSGSFKSSVNPAATKPKALIAAERKKGQDEKEAQRKLDQKREIERKRAAQQEEARRQEQLQREEAERQRERERSAAAEDSKNIAKRQAIEKRRLEMQKKDQQRVPQRPSLDHAPVVHQTQTAAMTRPELGVSRPPSRLQNVPDHSRPFSNHPAQNPAKPAIKRVFDPEADGEPPRPARPQGGPLYQTNEAKRRKTEEEDLQEVRVRPTMAPPIRQSAIRPGGPKASMFTNSYAPAPPPASHHHNTPSLLKSTIANQAYQQHPHPSQISRPGHHPDIAKYQNGRIPFADAPNPPAPSKTPVSRLPPQPAKSSPQYINGENIHLDDIPTESEDEYSDDDSRSKPKPSNLPDWAHSPQLRELLMTQDENMDADAVFGPVASPHMEEMFRERHHRFRSRTSSANWAGADRLTEDEIRRDVEARQRLRREGGWTFGL